MGGTFLLISSLAGIYLLQKAVAYWRAIRSLGNHPGVRYLFHPFSFFGVLTPRAKYINPGRGFAIIEKFEPFAENGYDIITRINVFPRSRPSLAVADPAAIKEITFNRARFPKPVQNYRVLTFFGSNIVASEGDMWKRYRKISAPAFSDRNNKLVWDETVQIMKGLFRDVWGDRDVITVDHCLDITLPIALFVIGVAGFGRRISWNDDDVVVPGHQMTFKEALHVATTDFMYKLIIPKRVLGLAKRGMRITEGFEELHQYMREMVRERQTAEKVERHDLFSSLLEASNNDTDGNNLTEDELIGNIYIFLVAGHETTAHTLCFTFALLALYEEEQEKLYRHIKTIIPDGRLPTYEEMPLLTQSMAVFNETLRMYPPVTVIPKEAAEDTTLSTFSSHGDRVTIPIPKGTNVAINVAGLHYNPRYWKDPHEFRPDRFLENWPRDAFLPFSGGARACIGRKFFETEGIAILTMLISKYKISVKEEPQFAGETFEQRRKRILASKAGLTVTPVRVPLVFTRRN